MLPDFAPMLLGVYHPRLLLITTPSYTFNARFTPPDAPSSVRSGYLDPTGRTDRIFRHHDHKFEWTVDEFQEYCQDVAEDWGYQVEVSGVGEACEEDPWGRDKELGFASQVAMFRREEGSECHARRDQRSQEFLERIRDRKAHQLLVTHAHPTHERARNPGSVEEIGEQVVKKMRYYEEEVMTLRELWFMREISCLCGGRAGLLGMAVERNDSLELRCTDEGVWEVRWLDFEPRLKEVEVQVQVQDPSIGNEQYEWSWGEVKDETLTDCWGGEWGSEGMVEAVKWGWD